MLSIRETFAGAPYSGSFRTLYSKMIPIDALQSGGVWPVIDVSDGNIHISAGETLAIASATPAPAFRPG